MFDIKKLFTPNTTLGRLEFLKILICLSILPFLAYLLVVFIPPNKICFLIFSIIPVICAVIFWICAYKRLKNIFNDKKITIISFILCLLINFIPFDRFLGLHTFPNDNFIVSSITIILLLTIPGKKESDKIISNKLCYIIFSIVVLMFFALNFPGIKYNMTGSAMADTLQPNDQVFVNIFEKNYKRGDIIVHQAEDAVYVKRIIGLPGEKIEIRWNNKKEYFVYINDKILDEPYVLDNKNWAECKYGTYCRYSKIPDDHYFVMGDNRENSLDSRHYGAVSRDKIKGRVMRIFYPFERAIEFERE